MRRDDNGWILWYLIIGVIVLGLILLPQIAGVDHPRMPGKGLPPPAVRMMP